MKGKREVVKMYKELLRMMHIFTLLIVVMSSQVWRLVKTHQTVHLKYTVYHTSITSQ